MRRFRPVSADWGFDRGLPVDRWYVERFLRRFSAAEGYAAGDVRGRVVEVGDDDYARMLTARSGPGTTIDVLHVNAANPKATVVGDLVTGDGVPSEAFDCLICTQTLHVIYNLHAAVRTIHAALRPGGVALVTVPGITRSCIPDRDLLGRLLAPDLPERAAAVRRRLRPGPGPGRGLRQPRHGDGLPPGDGRRGVRRVGVAAPRPRFRGRHRDPGSAGTQRLSQAGPSGWRAGSRADVRRSSRTRAARATSRGLRERRAASR